MGIRVASNIATPIKDWIRNFLNLFRKRKGEECLHLKGNFTATLWAIWLHRNEIAFKGGSPSPIRLLEIYSESRLRHLKATKKMGGKAGDKNTNTRVKSGMAGGKT